MLQDKTVVVGVTGGIAVYKVCELVSSLKKAGADVRVVMTKNATRFVAPLSFETLSARRVIIDMFDRDFPWEVEHIDLAKAADIFCVAPATANFCAKYALGVADDFLTTTALAMRCPVLVCPAMNTAMLAHPSTQKNLDTLALRGVEILYGGEGRLACGDEGGGRMAEPVQILSEIERLLTKKCDLIGKRILVTAGATSEDIDGVRCITNYSSGKMGIAIAEAACARGAEVTLVAGAVTAPLPRAGCKILRVKSTQDMYDAVMKIAGGQDAVIKAAAPADYRVAQITEDKIKSQELTLHFVKNPDIAAAVGAAKKPGQCLVVFCAETKDLIASAKTKLVKKNADLVVANDLRTEGAGFDVDTNVVTFVTRDGAEPQKMMTKRALGDVICDRVAAFLGKTRA